VVGTEFSFVYFSEVNMVSLPYTAFNRNSRFATEFEGVTHYEHREHM
jgi:hypothetical protein